MRDADSLDKVVPQNSRGILQHPDKRRDFDLIVLDCRSTPSIGLMKFPQIRKSGKAPITLFGNESMMRMTDGIYAGVVRVRDGESELSTCMPSFRCSLGIGVIQIDGDHVVRLPIGVSLRKQQYTPFVTAAAEFRTLQPLRLLAPILNLPCLRLEILYFLAEIRHVFGGECFPVTNRRKLVYLHHAALLRMRVQRLGMLLLVVCLSGMSLALIVAIENDVVYWFFLLLVVRKCMLMRIGGATSFRARSKLTILNQTPLLF